MDETMVRYGTHPIYLRIGISFPGLVNTTKNKIRSTHFLDEMTKILIIYYYLIFGRSQSNQITGLR